MTATEANDQIRVALIGYGLGGEVIHAPLIASTPRMSLVTIVTSDPGRQGRARERYTGARIVDDPHAIWEAKDDHDLVVVATPNVSHVPLGLEALRSGLAVVVDKPVAATTADGERLAREARAHSLLFSVFQNRRWDGDFLTVRRLIGSGAVGPIHRFESRFERWDPTPTAGAWRERGAPEDAGGLLFDLGSHLVDQAMQLFGRPTHVYAEVDLRRDGVEADDDVFVALRHRGGEHSHLWATAVAASPGPRFRVLGRDGAFEKHGLDVQEAMLAAGGLPSDPGWGREPEERWGTLSRGGTSQELVETLPGAYEAYYAGIAEAMSAGGPAPVDPMDSIAGLEILEAARSSARVQEVVTVPDRPDPAGSGSVSGALPGPSA